MGFQRHLFCYRIKIILLFSTIELQCYFLLQISPTLPFLSDNVCHLFADKSNNIVFIIFSSANALRRYDTLHQISNEKTMLHIHYSIFNQGLS